jgi:hypothetical protein
MGNGHHSNSGNSIEIMVELMKQFKQYWRVVRKNQRDWRGSRRSSS